MMERPAKAGRGAQHVSAEVSVDRLREHVRQLEGVRHPVAAPQALEAAADYVAGCLDELGYQVAEHLFVEDGRPYRNVIASRPGLGTKPQRIALVAHYDTVADSAGADDNASGVAALLEAARILAPLRFEETVDFIAVSLEENRDEGEHDSGTRGSKALAAHARANAWPVAAVVVLESVAYAGETVVQGAPPGVPVAVPTTGDFIAVIGNERSRQLVEGFCGTVGRLALELPCVPLVVPGNGELLPDSRRSDHAPFWDEGYAAIMLTDTTNFRNPNYHRPSDTLDTLNLEFAAGVCRAAAELVATLARPVG